MRLSIVWILSLCCVCTATAQQDFQPKAQLKGWEFRPGYAPVFGHQVNVRNNPDVYHSNILAVLDEGTMVYVKERADGEEFTVYGITQGWYSVAVPTTTPGDSLYGFIWRGHIAADYYLSPQDGSLFMVNIAATYESQTEVHFKLFSKNRLAKSATIMTVNAWGGLQGHEYNITYDTVPALSGAPRRYLVEITYGACGETQYYFHVLRIDHYNIGGSFLLNSSSDACAYAYYDNVSFKNNIVTITRTEVEYDNDCNDSKKKTKKIATYPWVGGYLIIPQE